MNSTHDELSVLVVGGRTTGMMMAAELARYGIAVRIIDQSPGIDPHSRATLLHSRTLEIFQTLGCADELVNGAQPLHGFVQYANGKLLGRSEVRDVDSLFPVGVAKSQAKTERTLEGHLTRLGVTVERNTKLIDFHQTTHSVVATLQRDDGPEQIVQAGWLIGCDGAHSTVRRKTNNSFPGQVDPFPYMLADVIVDGPLRADDGYAFYHDHGDLFLFLLDEGRRLVVASCDAEADVKSPLSLEEVQRTVDDRGIPGLKLRDPRWLTHFHINYRQAPHYRDSRIFLAGDAAHIHSLVGGHGMNTGIQDAHNLAWKLAMVIRGEAPEKWLNSYEAERWSVAKDVIASTKHATEQAESFASLSPAARERFKQHCVSTASQNDTARRKAEELDIEYRSSPLCSEPETPIASGIPAGRCIPGGIEIETDGRRCVLLDLLRRPRHQLLVFTSNRFDKTKRENVGDLMQVTDQHVSWIDVLIVRDPGDDDLIANSIFTQKQSITQISDPDGELSKAFDARNCGFYFIRPDGYVACRGNSHTDLSRYLDSVLDSHASTDLRH